MAEGEEAMDSDEKSRDQSDDDISRRTNRIMKIFGQITECLEDEQVARINEMLSQIIDLCKNKEKPVQELNKIYLEYLPMVEFKAGIPITLIKLSIQSFLMIENDPKVLGKKVKDMFMDMIVTEHPTLALDMKLNDELLKTYFRLVSEGSESALHMRLMIVGMFGVGKTTLVRRLCSQNITDVESTEGIDIFTETCEVKEDGDWIISKEKDKEQVFNIRLQTLLSSYTKDKPKESTHETIYDRKQTTLAQPDSGISENIAPVVELVKKDVAFKDFSTKVDGGDLRQRADVKTRKTQTRLPTISLWDFAGQSVYYSTHHFFLNDRSIYLLVLDLSKKLDDLVQEKDCMVFMPNSVLGNKTGFTCLEAFKFWMKSIYIYTKQKDIRHHGESTSRPRYMPRIVLIGTHKDEISSKQLNGRSYEQYKDDYFEEALKSFTNRPIADLVHPKKFLVNNLLPSDDEIAEFVKVKREIFSIAKEETPFLTEQIPATFIPLEKALFYSKRDKKQIISFGELQKDVSGIELPYDKSEIMLFLLFQHAFGNVIYFNTDTLSDMVILTPQWIINVFKAFVSHKPNKRLSEQEKWKDLTHLGILRDELIDELLEPDKDLYMYKDQIIKYMEHMDVIVRPVLFKRLPKEQVESDSDLKSEKFYIMPCLLPQLPNTEEMKTCFKRFQMPDENSNTPTLCLYFKQCFLPPFVVHSILASFVKEMKRKVLNGKQILYNGLGSFLFKDMEDRYLTLWSFEDILHLKISFIDKISEQERTKFCMFWRERIEQLVLDIFNFHGKDTYSHENSSALFEYRIKCPKCPEQMPCVKKAESDYMFGLLSVLDLQERKHGTIECPSCGKLTISKVILKDWFEITQDNEVEICLDKLPEEDRLADLSEEIPQNRLREVAANLSITEIQMERLEKKWSSMECLNYQVLYFWKKRLECWYVLYNALLNAGFGIEKEDLLRIIEGKETADVTDRVGTFMNMLGTDYSSTVDFKDDTLLHRLAACIGDEFWLLGVRLGVKESRIRKIWIDCNNKCDAVCFGILKEWRKTAGHPHIGLKALVRAMIKSGTDMPEVLKALAQ